MPITAQPVEPYDLRSYAYATLQTKDPRSEHILGFQAHLKSVNPQPNCLFIPIPGDDVFIVNGPSATSHFMRCVTDMLPALAQLDDDHPSTPHTIPNGDFEILVAKTPYDILSSLRGLHGKIKPVVDESLAELLLWFIAEWANYSFITICWQGELHMRWPVVANYVPHNDDVLYAPGVCSFDGEAPKIGVPTNRNMRVAFAVEGSPQPFFVHYVDRISVRDTYWAPTDVTGFYDNRPDGPNTHYVIPVETLGSDRSGWDLVDEMII